VTRRQLIIISALALLLPLFFLISCTANRFADYSLPLNEFKSKLVRLENDISLYINNHVRDEQKSLVTIKISIPETYSKAAADLKLAEILKAVLLSEADRGEKRIIYDIENRTGSAIEVSFNEGMVCFTVAFANAYYGEILAWLKEALFEKKLLTLRAVERQVAAITTRQNEIYSIFYKIQNAYYGHNPSSVNYKMLENTATQSIHKMLLELLNIKNMRIYFNGNVNPDTVYHEFQRYFADYEYTAVNNYQIPANSAPVNNKFADAGEIYISGDSVFPYEQLYFHEITASAKESVVFDFLNPQGMEDVVLYRKRGKNASGLPVLRVIATALFSDNITPLSYVSENEFIKRKHNILTNMQRDYQLFNNQGTIFFSQILTGKYTRFNKIKELDYKTYLKQIERLKINHQNYAIKKAGIEELYKTPLTGIKEAGGRQYVFAPGRRDTRLFFLPAQNR